MSQPLQPHIACLYSWQMMSRQRNYRIIYRTIFLAEGGVLNTTLYTGQQWDAPNGWAPMQWITYKGLKNYEHFLAKVNKATMVKNRRKKIL